ncbi:TonB-dependent receptor [Porticoccaceae bacterium]|nr:TonB-dependent receptor [Porticoccaceae bacterium]MDC1513643.1 TonB-dependent receptor [Porticoccaceae bacterium]
MYQLNLPEQTVAAALNSLSEQTDIQVLFPYDIAKSHSISPVNGRYTIQQALEIMLQNTGLYGGFTNSGIISISQAGINSGTNQNGKGKSMNIKHRISLLATLVGLFAAGGAATATAQDEMQESARAQGVLDEIIVTSTRREQNLNDTALSVAAFSGEDIARRNLAEMNDYLRTVPGVSFVDIAVGQNGVVTRGIGIDPQNEGGVSSATTGVYFGEVSIAALSTQGGSADIRMVDLERVEVLRGPQGTLFGSGSLAGAVRNIPNTPKLDELGGNLKTTFSNTNGFGGDNSKLEGVINFPVIEDVLAIRAVAYHHDTSGYIKNVAGTQLATNGLVFPSETAQQSIARNGPALADMLKNQNDVGAATFDGARISALWKPTDELSVTLMHLYQEGEQIGRPYVELIDGIGDYAQVDFQFSGELAHLEPKMLERINLTNLMIEYDLGWGNILSSTAWFDNTGANYLDQSGFVGQAFFAAFGESNKQFSQELRLVSQLDGPIQYTAGIYYEDRSTGEIFGKGWAGTNEVYNTLLTAFQLPAQPFPGSLQMYNFIFDESAEQLAFYGEVSYAFTEQLELTLGVRRFDYERINSSNGDGIFTTDTVDKTDHQDSNFKVNLSYTPNDNALIYAQWAEGFRLGNTNPFINRVTCDANNDGILDGSNAPIRDGFESDSMENFELGMKLTLLDNRLQVNAAIYRMNWEGIPLTARGGALPGQAQTCFQYLTVNAGEARSQGFELETIYQISENLRATFGGAYTNAELTADAPELGGFDGDRLPSSPEYTVNAGLQYDFELGGHPTYISGDYAYVGEFYNRLGEDRNPRSYSLGDYAEVSLSAGIIYEQFNIELFARNLTDEDALTHADTSFGDDRAYQLRPRTIGLNIGYQF